MVGWLLLAMGGVARADDDPSSCAAAAEEGERLTQAGKLLEARAAVGACLKVECPAVVRKHCGEQLANLGARLPSLAVRVLGPDGDDLAAATYTVDGAEPSAVDGHARPLNPGRHVIEAHAAGYPPARQTVVVAAGERDRVVVMRLDAPRASSVRPVVFWSAAGLAAVAFTSATVFGVRGIEGRSDLGECRPSCSTAAVDAVRTDFIVADVSAVVGVVAVGVAAYVLLSRPSAPGAQAMIHGVRF
jgi:hypothetical protein